MIRLAIAALAGGAGCLAAWVLLGGDVTAAIAGAVAAAIVVDAIFDVVRADRDRRQAYRRWREWTRHG